MPGLGKSGTSRMSAFSWSIRGTRIVAKAERITASFGGSPKSRVIDTLGRLHSGKYVCTFQKNLHGCFTSHAHFPFSEEQGCCCHRTRLGDRAVRNHLSRWPWRYRRDHLSQAVSSAHRE